MLHFFFVSFLSIAVQFNKNVMSSHNEHFALFKQMLSMKIVEIKKMSHGSSNTMKSWFLIHLLQVRLNLQVNLFQPRSICFNQGQLVSTQVSLGQVQNTGHRSLFYQYRKYPKHY